MSRSHIRRQSVSAPPREGKKPSKPLIYFSTKRGFRKRKEDWGKNARVRWTKTQFKERRPGRNWTKRAVVVGQGSQKQRKSGDILYSSSCRFYSSGSIYAENIINVKVFNIFTYFFPHFWTQAWYLKYPLLDITLYLSKKFDNIFLT